MENKPGRAALQNKISLLQKILDMLREMFRIQTQLEKLLWEEIARSIGSKYKIDVDVFVAVIWAESGMNPKAVNKNPNGTTDFGICQFNDYWYRRIISPHDALNHPETAINVMAQQWEKGRQNDWIAYRNKSYIKYLKSPQT